MNIQFNQDSQTFAINLDKGEAFAVCLSLIKAAEIFRSRSTASKEPKEAAYFDNLAEYINDLKRSFIDQTHKTGNPPIQSDLPATVRASKDILAMNLYF